MPYVESDGDAHGVSRMTFIKQARDDEAEVLVTYHEPGEQGTRCMTGKVAGVGQSHKYFDFLNHVVVIEQVQYVRKATFHAMRVRDITYCSRPSAPEAVSEEDNEDHQLPTDSVEEPDDNDVPF